MSTCKKKRRRSSLAAAKIKLELSPGLGKDLCGKLELGVPEGKRLEQLVNLCLKVAIDSVSVETDSQEVKDQLENVLKLVPVSLSQPQIQEAFHHACQVGQQLPNPANIEMDETAALMEARIAKLKQEEQDWYEYFQDLDAGIAEAERRASMKSLPGSELTSTQKDLSKTYLPVWAELPMVQQQVADASSKATLLVLEHEKNVHKLNQVEKEINSRLDRKLRQLYEKSHGFIGSPNSRLQNFLTFPTPPSV